MSTTTKAGRRAALQRHLEQVTDLGLVRGEVALLTGPNREDNSTILRRAAYEVAIRGGEVLYVSGADTVGGVAQAFKNEGLVVPPQAGHIAMTSIDGIAGWVASFRPHLVVLDELPGFGELHLALPRFAGEVSRRKGGPRVLMSTSGGDVEHTSPVEAAYVSVFTMNLQRTWEVSFTNRKNRNGHKLRPMTGQLWTRHGIGRMALTLTYGRAR